MERSKSAILENLNKTFNELSENGHKEFNIGMHICNMKEPFIMTEAFARVCTGKVDKLLDEITNNLRYFPANQAANSIRFCVTALALKNHLSVFAHVNYEFTFTTDTHNLAKLNNYMLLSQLNREQNLGIRYTLTNPGTDRLKISINLRSIIDIFNALIIRLTDERPFDRANHTDDLLAVLVELLLECSIRNSALCVFLRHYVNSKAGMEFGETNSYYMEFMEYNILPIDKDDLIVVRKAIDTRINQPYTNIKRVPGDNLIANHQEITANLLALSPESVNENVTLVLTAPMPILEHFLRHQEELAVTKLSGRYTDFENMLVYARESDFENNFAYPNDHYDATAEITKVYKALDNESKRFITPMGAMSLMVYTKPLRLLLKILEERLPANAQLESQYLALQICDILMVTCMSKAQIDHFMVLTNTAKLNLIGHGIIPE